MKSKVEWTLRKKQMGILDAGSNPVNFVNPVYYRSCDRSDLLCLKGDWSVLEMFQIFDRISAPRASVSSDLAKQKRSTLCGGGSR